MTVTGPKLVEEFVGDHILCREMLFGDSRARYGLSTAATATVTLTLALALALALTLTLALTSTLR